jgi:multiple antibiotic resistance protein
MRSILALFLDTFSTLLAIINPLEALPIFLMLTAGKDADEQKRVARRSCFYATVLLLFFLIFGTLLLRLFGVSMSMVRFVGGIVLLRIGFQLFSGSSSRGPLITGNEDGNGGDVAFVPLAMPIMFGPGAIATTLGMTSLVKKSDNEIGSFVAITIAMLATMFVTYLCLAFSKNITKRLGPMGIDAITRIVGFFVAAMGGGLAFHGVMEALQTYGLAVH